MGAMSKRKGKTGELEVAALLRSYGFEARRGQQFKGSSDSPDVVHSIPRVHIEVKRVEALHLWPALEQAFEEAEDADVPVVFHRKSRKPWVAILKAEDFLRIMAEVPRGTEQED